jgi:hypothetical protein
MIKFSDYLDYLCLASAMEELADDEVIIEWTELEWLKLSIAERAEIEAEESDLEERKSKKYKAKNTQQRRATQRNKDKLKFHNRQGKLKDKIERKKGGNKVRRLKVRKKWKKLNKSKIKNAQKVYGGKVHSKFTKTGPHHKRGGR